MREKAALPTVQGSPIFGCLLDFRKDRIGFLNTVNARDGAVVRSRLGFIGVVISADADFSHEVLVEQSDAFMKGYGLSVFTRPLLGNGLLSSEGAFHKKQRRMMAPAFVHKRIAEYADVIADRTERAVEGWRDGATIDASEEMMRLTLSIVGKTLFNAEVASDAAEIGAALTLAMEHFLRSITSVIPIPPSVPTPANLRNRRVVERLDSIIYRLIRERRADGRDHGDFLSMLLLAEDEDDKGSMTDQQVRDEAMTIFLAGHETTANALAWTFYLLSQHPDVRSRLEAEVDAALGGRPPTLADLGKLPYALAVFKESMRLYPPAYMITRKALRDVSIGQRAVKKGEVVIINIAGMHRNSAHFKDPDRFDPGRFAPEAEKALPRHAYIPFGAGPRVCIGNHFALMEGHLVLAGLVQRARLDLSPRHRRIEPQPLITLRPRGGMPMRVERRDAASKRAVTDEARVASAPQKLSGVPGAAL
jgi:cytochrome P450